MTVYICFVPTPGSSGKFWSLGELRALQAEAGCRAAEADTARAEGRQRRRLCQPIDFFLLSLSRTSRRSPYGAPLIQTGTGARSTVCRHQHSIFWCSAAFGITGGLFKSYVKDIKWNKRCLKHTASSKKIGGAQWCPEKRLNQGDAPPRLSSPCLAGVCLPKWASVCCLWICEARSPWSVCSLDGPNLREPQRCRVSRPCHSSPCYELNISICISTLNILPWVAGAHDPELSSCLSVI